MKEKIQNILSNIPDKPGVYLMKDAGNEIIYIGKAKALKNRVRSYFNKELHSPKIEVMVPKIEDIDFISTDNEMEAIVLEDALIKKYKPRYNTLLKDDKKFPWIEITDEDYPRILFTRKPEIKSKRGNVKYFGPYVNAKALYATINFLKEVFPLKQCKKPVYRTKPCLNYHINRCSGPCQKLVTPEEYKELLKQIELFLSGKQTQLLDKLNNMMQKASKNLEFEKAARYRDTIKSIEKLVDTQKVVFDDIEIQKDIFAYVHDEKILALVLFKIREGKLFYKESFQLTINEIDSAEETFWIFIESYYKAIQVDDIPSEIILPVVSEDIELFRELLKSRTSKQPEIILPQEGINLDLIKMAEKNAAIALENFQLKSVRELQNQWNEVGATLQKELNLPLFPQRVECFDISHLSGTDTVASMVVFIDGKAAKSEYRKFKIRSLDNKIDDFAAMEEVVTRRYSRLLKENKKFPDLIVIDGGKGQLGSVMKGLKQLGIKKQSVVSIAKKFEEIYLPESKIPVIFDKDSPVLFFFQQIRDEAHRFAITYQKKLRDKKLTESILDSIAHIGKKRKALLLKHFGTVEKIFQASIEDIAEAKGIHQSLAEHIYQNLHTKNNDKD